MVLGTQVVAASDPKEEEDDEPFCACICFCEEEDEDGEGDADCTCFCFCEDDPEEEEEEEELIDPQDTLKESCSEKRECVTLKEKLDECNARVEGRSKTSETCTEEIIDFMHCVDHCVAKSLFTKLK
ncbi:cytochrome b-c1 complex subunit 6, mitochondrial [Aplysia californica]|uniref:Cytochrome b-c1 complex subunit 6, mitochondrial n=1 Tax=Aplysia californica TaxID=6500 RepID=A0ABM0K6P9_APLCA|nr:cytochrome b-c1 complex subunit 6, mitochondrial [Aplysia californica]